VEQEQDMDNQEEQEVQPKRQLEEAVEEILQN